MLLLPLGLLAPPPVAPLHIEGPLLLDGLSCSVAGAYALRKLRGPYAGPAVRVRRSSNNDELDIPFKAGLLDTTALLAFCGGGDGWAVKWFDQSTAGQDMTQAVASRQPQIVAGGALLTLGNAAAKPALGLSGASQQFLANTAFAWTGAAAALCSVASRAVSMANGYARLASFAAPGSHDNQPYGLVWGYLESGTLYGQSASGGDYGRKSRLALGTAPAQIASAFDGARHSMTIDGASGGFADAADTFSATGTVTLGNDDQAGQGWDGLHAEHLIISSALSAADQATIRADQQLFHGTP